MRKMVLLIIAVMIIAAFAGCFGGGEENKKAKEPVLVQRTEQIPKMSGWIDDDGNQHASDSFDVALNNTNIVSVKFKIKVEDSDAAHSDSDQGSKADEITVTVNGGNNTDSKTGTTPFNANIDFTAPGGAEALEYLGQSWTIVIDANLGGGKPMYFFGFIVWVDQGVAYTIEGEYSYMAPEIEPTG